MDIPNTKKIEDSEETTLTTVGSSASFDLNDPVKVDSLNSNIVRCLESMELPSKEIFASIPERKNVFKNFPAITGTMDPDIKRNSYYLSKFFAATTVGLFDAALNYLWDAIVENLRYKIIKFDVGYFFDSHPNRGISSNSHRNEEELRKISDQDLIDGSLAIGIITNVIYQEISLIKYMRNHASAAHPNLNEIRGLSLIGWLDACNKGLFEKEFPTSAVVAQKFIVQIKSTPNLSPENIRYANKSLSEELKTEQIDSLLKALIGVYLDPQSPPHARNNVFHFAEILWKLSSDSPKNEIGIQYAHYSANQIEQKTSLIKSFLEKVNGLSYLPEDVRILELENLIQTLRNTHNSSNNFYNEPPVAKEIRKYVSDTGKIPKQIRANYVKVLISCRLGNGYGVSRDAVPFYDELIDLFQHEEIIEFCKLILDEEIISKLGRTFGNPTVYISITKKLKNRTSGILEEFLDYLISKPDALSQMHKYKHIKEHLEKLQVS